MKSVKILAALLAVSVAGVASAATLTKGGTSISTNAAGHAYSCKEGTQCSISDTQSIGSAGLVLSYYCETSKKVYSAPKNVTVSVNGGNVYCTAFTFAGKGVGTSPAAPSTSGSLGQLMCTLSSGSSAQSIKTTNIDCSSNATSSALMTATNTNTTGW